MSKLKTKKYNAVANAEKDASQTFVKGAAILTLSMVIVKVFGLLDKVILTGIFSGVSFEQAVAGGTETVNFASFGLGLYSNAYEIFVVIFTVATGGLPIAISRLVSESTAQKRFNDVKQIHRVSIPFFVIVGILSFAILVGASFIYVQIIESPYSLLGMLCLSPTVLFGLPRFNLQRILRRSAQHVPDCRFGNYRGNNQALYRCIPRLHHCAPRYEFLC